MEQTLGAADLLGVAATVNSAFLFAFSSLFSIINPVGGALIFAGYTRRFDHPSERKSPAGSQSTSPC